MAEQPNIPPDLRYIVVAALDQAARRGALSAEAEDLLLVIAETGTPEADVLARAGLDYDGILRLLREERGRSLAALGLTDLDRGRLRSTPRVSRPGWGTSLRTALLRSRRRGARRLTPADAAIGVLLADYGTVARVLSYAGIDRDELVSRLRELAA